MYKPPDRISKTETLVFKALFHAGEGMGYVKHVDARGGDADRIVFASSCPGISRVSVTADTLAAINQRCGGPSWHCHFGSSLGATDIFTELTVNGQMPEKESLGGSNGV